MLFQARTARAVLKLGAKDVQGLMIWVQGLGFKVLEVVAKSHEPSSRVSHSPGYTAIK